MEHLDQEHEGMIGQKEKRRAHRARKKALSTAAVSFPPGSAGIP